MNIIHNTSLASYPIGYPRTDRSDAGNRQPQPATGDQRQTPAGQQIPASTPSQIQTAIEDSGLNTQDQSLSQQNTPYANKALQTYQQTRNQALQTQLENSFTGVDFYA